MRALVFVFTLTIIGGQGKEWDKIDDLKEVLKDYNESADKIVQSTLRTMSNTKLSASQFVDHLLGSQMSTISRLNDTECYQTLFNPEFLLASFQLEVARSQVPMENVLVELRDKLDGINNSIYMFQDLADNKYSICKVLNKSTTCEDETKLWLDEIIKTIHCQLTPNCNNHIITKRSASNFCSVGSYQCDKKCISLKSICDRKNDCYDGSDEDNCCYGRGFGGNGFYCSENSLCKSHSLICNGRKDCSDGSDELHCGTMANTTCSIEFGRHQCNYGKCIGVEQVCDGIQDCDDGSDESTLCGSGTCPEDCTNKGGVCFLGPQGPRCLAECPLGTFQTPAGCTAHPPSINRTVVELLHDIPALASRHQSRFTYLKIKSRILVSKMISDVIKCAEPEFPLLSKVVSFNIKKQPTVAPVVTTPVVTTESNFDDY